MNEELKFLGKLTKKKSGGGGGRERGFRWGGRVGGGQGGCERRIEVFVKFQKKKNRGVGGVGGRGSGWWGGGGVRVDVNEELKFLGKFKKNGGGVGRGGQVGGRVGGGSGWM